MARKQAFDLSDERILSKPSVRERMRRKRTRDKYVKGKAAEKGGKMSENRNFLGFKAA